VSIAHADGVAAGSMNPCLSFVELNCSFKKLGCHQPECGRNGAVAGYVGERQACLRLPTEIVGANHVAPWGDRLKRALRANRSIPPVSRAIGRFKWRRVGERSRGLDARPRQAHIAEMTLSISRTDSQDLSVVVKIKGTDSKPWKWVIYSAGRKSPMISSPENFGSMAGAYKAGKEALKKFLEQPQRPRSPNY
jgi:hypothetical protein